MSLRKGEPAPDEMPLTSEVAGIQAWGCTVKDLKQVVAVKEVETRRELYDSYLDRDWTELMTLRVPQQLDAAFSSMCLAWKEAVNTQRIPFLMVEQMASFANGYMRARPPKGRRMIDALQIDIQRRLSGNLRRHDRKQIQASLKKADQAMRIADERVAVQFPKQQYWDEVIENIEIRLCITGAQNQGFCSLVFAYECFVVACFEALGGDPKKRIAHDPFWNDFAARLGRDAHQESPQTKYWNDPIISTAREVRHSFAHRGGKVKREDMREGHGFYISPMGIVTVKPENNRELYRVMKSKVTDLVAEMTQKLTPPDSQGV